MPRTAKLAFLAALLVSHGAGARMLYANGGVGSPGPAGPIGATGATGAAGPAGYAGTIGTTGATGTNAATAAALSSAVVIVTSTPTGTGVILSLADHLIVNRGAY